MAVDISTMAITQAMLAMMWAALNVQIYKNPLFTTAFSDFQVLHQIFVLASLTFCPGLLEALQALSPPSIDWFRSRAHTSDGVKLKEVWGIYFLVMFKLIVGSRIQRCDWPAPVVWASARPRTRRMGICQGLLFPDQIGPPLVPVVWASARGFLFGKPTPILSEAPK